MNNNIQTIITAWNTTETYKASSDDFIMVALNSLGITGELASAYVDLIGDEYYDLGCDGATQEALAAFIIKSVTTF